MPTVSLYLSAPLLDRLKSSSEAEGRSLSNFVARQLEALMRDGHVELDPSVREPGRFTGYESRQVDLVDAIAGKILAGPARSRRAPRPLARSRAHK